MNWQNLLFALGAILLIVFTIRMIRNNPAAFSKDNLSKSFFTVGLLTLLIIAVVAICVYFLRHN